MSNQDTQTMRLEPLVSSPVSRLFGPAGFTTGLSLAVAFAAIITVSLLRPALRRVAFSKASVPAHSATPVKAGAVIHSERASVGFLQPRDFQSLPLVKREQLSHDSVKFTFALPTPDAVLGLPTGQHVAIRARVDDGSVISRSYSPTSNDSDTGQLELVVKLYADGLLTGQYLSKLREGDKVEFRGPKGAMRYHSGYARRIGMVAGGSGITPLFQVIRAVCENTSDQTELSLVYANKSEEDILLRTELDRFAAMHPKKLKIHYLLDKAGEGWTGGRGRCTKDVLAAQLPAPSENTRFMLCGPPGLVSSMKGHLVELGCRKPGVVSKMNDDIFCF